MYAKHVPLLRKHGLGSYEGFADIVTFVILSVRQPFVRIPEHLKDVRAQGENSRHLWGWKMDGYRAVRDDLGRRVWERLKECRYAEDAIRELVAIPGLQIVKAAFVAQMFGFDTACLDTRNIRRLGLKPRAFRWEKYHTERTRDRLIEDYTAYCREQGGAEHFWDTWCAEVAADNGETPLRVSAMHLAAISDRAMYRAQCQQ